jgi:2',3'-cyclic-nucleotide 2'-phosphodiesterase (5'-nucleotidase family)/predicted AlkP superfamily phosphohydrolase/phosphomutase
MARSRRVSRFNLRFPAPAGVLGLLVAIGLIVGPAATSAALQATPAAMKPASHVILFASDGARPDLIQRYADSLPTLSALKAAGVTGDDGMLQAFPPNTGTGWATIATGTWPGEHGSMNNTFYRTGAADFDSTASGFAPGILQADTIGQAAERAGKTVVAVEWTGAGGYDPALQGPVIDYRSFFSNRGVLTNYDLPDQPAEAEMFGLSYQRVDLEPAEGWTGVPESFSPAMEQQLVQKNTAFMAEDNVDRAYDLYVYDSTDDGAVNYDKVLVVPTDDTADGSPVATVKDGAKAVAHLAAGEWADVKVTLTGERAGQTAGFYLKAIEIAPDLSRFRIYYTSIQRANARYDGCTYAANCAGPMGFAETLAKDFPSATGSDFAPLEAGLIDEDTYVEQGLKWQDAESSYLRYIVQDLGVTPDLLLLGSPVTDEFSHQFLGLVTETNADGSPNPFYDDVNGDGTKDSRVEMRDGYLRSAYETSDQFLGLAQELLGGDVTTFVTSDHGFAPAYWSVNAGLVLQQAGITDYEQTENCKGPATDVAAVTPTADPNAAPTGPKLKVCWVGGSANVYANLAGRDPGGVVTEDEYDGLRDQITAAFMAVKDPTNPNATVVAKVLKNEELRDVDGTDALHPSRSGDLVVVLSPPYQFEAPTPGKLIAPSGFFGQHGYLPDLVDLANNIDLHATFIAGGPGIATGGTVGNVRAIDVAPTVAFLLGIPGPQNARGQILYSVLADGSRLKEVTILDISDYHGQLVPLSATVDSFTEDGAQLQSAAVGGAAYLKPWFDAYRAEATGLVLTIAAGDSEGATPPISSFFGDKPTVEIMNDMGFSADGLGNHNFDKGFEYMAGTLKPLARFPYLSINVVDDQGKTNEAWSPSTTFEVEGAKIALIGFTNTDAPSLVFPNAFGPYKVVDPVPLINEEAARLRGEGVDAVVAMGHRGATGGTLTEPTGPLVDTADGVTGIDAVIGDHTDVQVLTTRPNGVLVTENRSKGVMFTRVRLTIDTATHAVVYRTADFHRPWTIGVTPDATIQGKLSDLTAQLQPILGAQIGVSTVPIPRADSCGTGNGRTCESLVGDVVTDAMRTTYGADVALTNSGGLRADLTCPAEDNPDDFCAADLPANAITRGKVLEVLPFGNVAATAEISGTELKEMLEHGVAAMPESSGGFPQVSGICFTYDVTAAPGSRVRSVVKQNDDGSCSTEQLDLSDSATYTLVTNDFTAAGGDGYPNIRDRATTRDVLDQVVADAIAKAGTISPSIQGRIVCTGDGCPVQTP